jgi:CheY-like chemotaxis protein
MKSEKPRILIVEDDKLLSFVEERLVKKLGYALAGKAENGEEAIEYVKEEDPDLIIMDIRLNGSMDGVEAMMKIRDFSSTPVIFLSGDSKDETQARIDKVSNCVSYLVKPVNADDLREPLQSVFNDTGKESRQPETTQTKKTRIASA